MHLPSLPILSIAQTQAHERAILGNDLEKTWKVMQRVGQKLGQAVLEDFPMWHPLPRALTILTVCGKGHNAADALLATKHLLEARPRSQAILLWVFGKNLGKPFLARALEDLEKTGRIISIEAGTASIKESFAQALKNTPNNCFDITLDGLFGISFQTPLPSNATECLSIIGEDPSYGLRIAVDLPSGLLEAETQIAFKAHFTYQTGVPKRATLDPSNKPFVGRLRVLDVGLFEDSPIPKAESQALLPSAIAPFGTLRKATTHKYKEGTVAIVAGSADYPGALLLATQGALYSGAGLVRAFAPENLLPAFAAKLSEVIWQKTPSSPKKALQSLESVKGLKACVIGPGLGRHQSGLVKKLLQKLAIPILLDADALSPEIYPLLKERAHRNQITILTPHEGEFFRLTGISCPSEASIKAYAKDTGTILLLKGAPSCITDGDNLYYILHGNPVLARGGSGDVLSGLIGGSIAQNPEAPAFAITAQATLWHALAADAWARYTGEKATHTCDIFPFFAQSLRHEAAPFHP